MKNIIYFILFLFAHLNISAQTKYQLYADQSIIDRSHILLEQQVGVKEKTNKNDGKEVEKYLASIGLKKGNAWCNALQYWCYYQAAKDLGLDKSYIPMPRNGVANSVFVYAKKYKEEVLYKPEIHDFLIWRLQGSSYKGHIARIIAVKRVGWVLTIEGNTSRDGTGNQRNGDGCFKKERNLYHPVGRLQIRGLVGIKKKEISQLYVYKCTLT